MSSCHTMQRNAECGGIVDAIEEPQRKVLPEGTADIVRSHHQHLGDPAVFDCFPQRRKDHTPRGRGWPLELATLVVAEASNRTVMGLLELSSRVSAAALAMCCLRSTL